MTPHELPTTPFWMEMNIPRFAALTRNIDVDVVIVGGGLTGLTTAYLLSQESVRVAVVERGRLAATDTGHTTAHLTYVTDYRFHELVDRFGKEAAREFWNAGRDAIDQIEAIARQTQAECAFKRVPGYLHLPVAESESNATERMKLERDADLATELKFRCELVDSAPHGGRDAIRFFEQAKFHPRRYLNALAQAIVLAGGLIFEETEFESVDPKSMTLHANGKRVRCDYLVIATHNPLIGKKGLLSATLFQTKLSLYTSYVLGATLPHGTLPEALFWDTNDPYEYLRVDDRGDHLYAIFGGCDVKTGQEDSAERTFDRLAKRFEALFPAGRITHRWLGQVVETDDGLPFIGENANREFIATGFCGNGFTLGTASAMMARDRILLRDNPYFDLFRVDRKPFHGGAWRYIKENADFPARFVSDRLKRTQESLEDVAPGEGKIVLHDGKKMAAYRDDNGDLSVCSPVCTHLKCLVRWNDADRTWDCPCHGSRFRTDGTVLSGPAEYPLERVDATSAAEVRQ